MLLDNTFKVLRNIELANDFLVRKDALNAIPFPLIFRSVGTIQTVWCNQAAKALGFTAEAVTNALERGDPGRVPFSTISGMHSFVMQSTPILNLEGHTEGHLLWPMGAGMFAGSALLHTGLAVARDRQWTYMNPVARTVLGILDDAPAPGWDDIDWLPDWDEAMAKGSGTILVTEQDGYEVRVHGSGQWMALEAMPEFLMQGDRLTGDVVAALMHEIRNPLAVLSGHIELAGMRTKDPDLRNFLMETMNEVHQLAKITEDILWATRDTILRPVTIEMESFIRKCWEDITGVTSRPIRLVLKAPVRARVSADPDRLRHIFFNLFKNAHEAMLTTGNQVTVTITKDPHRIWCCVEDDGPGIPNDVMRRLFRGPQSTKPNGSGLGLSIVRRLIHAHGGTLTVESVPGETRFRFDLPNPEAPPSS